MLLHALEFIDERSKKTCFYQRYAYALPVQSALDFFNNRGIRAIVETVSRQGVVAPASLPVVVCRAGGPKGARVPQAEGDALPLGVGGVDVVALLVGRALVVCPAAHLHAVVVGVALQALGAHAEGLVEVNFAVGPSSADLVQAGVHALVVDTGLGPRAVSIFSALVWEKG